MNTKEREKPIGIFDSGVGGLTVLREMLKLLPAEDTVYLGDTARVPYGTKSSATVTRFALENSHFLLKHEIKLLVIACNTASAYSLEEVSRRLPIPVVGVINPGARAASLASHTKRVGVIGTAATIQSQAYERALHALDPRLKIFTQACPLFVPLIEEGWIEDEVTLTVTKRYLASLQEADIDTLVLGCTHYPLIKPALKGVMGEGVSLIDSAEETAREVRRVLEEANLLKLSPGRGENVLYVTDVPVRFEKVSRLFMGNGLPHPQQVDLL
jgi:glutamate racemase